MVDWLDRTPTPLGELSPRGRETIVLARGEIAQVLGAIELPVALPKGAPSLGAIALLGIDVEFQPFWSRPVRERHERGRAFVLRDPSGRALVRVNRAGPAGARGALDEGLDLKLGRPFVQGLDGSRDVLARALAIGDEAVVAGRVRIGEGAAEAEGGLLLGSAIASYREPPRITILEAVAVFDADGFAMARRWRALPWWRKLAVLVGNR